MILADAAQSFSQTIMGQIIIPLVSAAIVAIAGAMIKVVLDISSLKQSVKSIGDDIAEIKGDPDTMRWSSYNGGPHRGVQGRRQPGGKR